MNERRPAHPERRKFERIAPKGAVVLRMQAHALQGRLVNLAEGGLFVASTVSAPDHWLGGNLEVEVRLDGGGAEWLRATGRVARIAGDGVAIAFSAPPPVSLVRMIEDLTSASRADARVLSVVLIDAEAERRSAMASGFREAGCRVIEAATPLEAIVRLGESSFEPDVIAVADTASREAEEMRVFVERDHPRAKLVTIGDALLAPDGTNHWLSSADPLADLPSRVRDVLLQRRR